MTEDQIDGLARIVHRHVQPEEPWEDCPGLHEYHRAVVRDLLAAYNPDVRLSTVTDEMIQAGRAEAFNQDHRTYGDMCRAIFVAMRDEALSPLSQGED